MSVERAISLLQEAIGLLSGKQNFPATQVGVDAAAAQYLRENVDVANHVYFGKHPLEHWQLHGEAEYKIGRRQNPWPTMVHVVEDQRPTEATVTTLGGRSFPAPDARENAMGYIQRVGTSIGRQDEWARVAGTLRLGVNHLVPKHVPYPDGYGPWLDDRANWPTLAEAFWFPVAQPDDTGWQQVHDRMKDRDKPSPVAPQLPPGEEPL